MRKNPIVDVTFVRPQQGVWLYELFTVEIDNQRHSMCASAAVELFGATKGVPGSLHIIASRGKFAGSRYMRLVVDKRDYVTLPSGERVILIETNFRTLRLLFPDASAYVDGVYRFYFKAEFTPAPVPTPVQ